MKIYLAGPMRGLPEYNFPSFHAAAKRLRDAGHEVFSPAEKDLANGFNPLTDTAQEIEHYMLIDLPEVRNADAVALLPGWWKSEGVWHELIHAEKHSKRIIHAWSMEDAIIPEFFGEDMKLTYGGAA